MISELSHTLLSFSFFFFFSFFLIHFPFDWLFVCMMKLLNWNWLQKQTAGFSVCMRVCMCTCNDGRAHVFMYYSCVSFSYFRSCHSFFLSFLDAFSHLYKRVCPSVGWSVRLYVRWSVGHTQVEFLKNLIFRLKWNKIELRT